MAEKCEICGEPMPPGEQVFKYHGFSGPCPRPPKSRVATGIELIAQERKRQIEEKGYNAAHDDKHPNGEITVAAVTYAGHALAAIGAINSPSVASVTAFLTTKRSFGWTVIGGKDPIADLAKSGALIAAEIDRLQRALPSQAAAPANETTPR